MHRSGTSMVTGILKKCGLHLGSNLLMGARDNPTGHFEDRRFIRINERILRVNGGFWHTPPKKIRRWPMADMKAFIKSWPKNRLVGWKDPRTCITLEGWVKAIEPEPVTVVYVVRPMAEVAASLKKRNGFPEAKSKKLYWEYIRRALKNLEGLDWMATSYHSYFKDWEKELAPILKFLGISMPKDKIKIESFIKEELWHHRK